MANLIIKPSSGGDLVIKGSDDSPAITVGTTGTLTFAENVTMSGTANNLGTVTAGTFPAPSATALYPAGHVLQVKGVANDYNWGTITGTETHASWVDVVITTKGANSSFLQMARMSSADTSNSDMGAGIGFRYLPTGGSEVEVSGAHPHEEYTGTHMDQYKSMANSMFTTTSIAIGTEVTFRVYVDYNVGGTFHSLNSNKSSSHTVMEIKA